VKTAERVTSLNGLPAVGPLSGISNTFHFSQFCENDIKGIRRIKRTNNFHIILLILSSHWSKIIF